MEEQRKRIVDKHGIPLSPDPGTRPVRRITRKTKRVLIAIGTILAFSAALLKNLDTVRNALFPKRDLVFDLAVQTASGMAEGGPGVSIPVEDKVTYTRSPAGNESIVTYMASLPFQTLGKDGTVEYDNSKVGIVGLELDFPFPAIDIKVENNSKRDVFINGATVQVESVTADNSPLIVQEWHGFGGVAEFRNYGWGPAIETAIHFRVTPSEGHDQNVFEDIDEPLGTLEPGGGSSVNIKSEIEHESNIGFGDFKIPASALYGKVVNLTGTVSYMGSMNARFQTNVDSKVPLFSSPLGPVLPSYRYDLDLKSSEGPTMKHLDLSQEVRPGHSDRFQIVVNADRSATYHLRIKLLGVSGSLYESEFAIRLFRPKIHIRSASPHGVPPAAESVP